MNYMLLLTISSSVLTIIGFFISVLKNNKWRTSILCAISSVIFVCISIHVHNLETRIDRIENIQKAASKLVEQQYSAFTSEGFVQASLSFLETNKDIYPDTYTRAVGIAQRMHQSESIFSGVDAAREISGIIKGIAILNEE